jgi:hypothetical protein
MRLLPSERADAVEQALIEYKKSGHITIREPCDCGSRIQHNDGGNYHRLITLKNDGGILYVKYDTTCVLTPAAEWEESYSDIEEYLNSYADWL